MKIRLVCKNKSQIDPFYIEIQENKQISDLQQMILMFIENKYLLSIDSINKLVLLSNGHILQKKKRICDTLYDNQEVQMILKDKQLRYTKAQHNEEQDTPPKEQMWKLKVHSLLQTPNIQYPISESPLNLPNGCQSLSSPGVYQNDSPQQKEYESFPISYVSFMQNNNTDLIINKQLCTPRPRSHVQSKLERKIAYMKLKHLKSLKILKQLNCNYNDEFLLLLIEFHKGDLELIIQHISQLNGGIKH